MNGGATYGVAVPHAFDTTELISVVLDAGCITAPQGSVPIALPGQPHFDLQAATQLPVPQLRREQAGPALAGDGITERTAMNAATDKEEKRAILCKCR